jgi:hypothetical protein
MSRIVIIILMYHRHTPTDLTVDYGDDDDAGKHNVRRK